MKAVFSRESLWEDAHLLSTNYLAREFSHLGWEILWLTRPWHPYGLLFPRWMPQKLAKLRMWWNGGEFSNSGGVRSYAFGTLLPYRRMPLLGSQWVAQRTLDLALPPVRLGLRRMGFETVDLFVLSDLCQAPLLRWVKSQRSIYHATDDYLSFPWTPPSAKFLEKWIIENVDMVVTPGARLAEALARRHEAPRSKFVVLPHGVEESILAVKPLPADFQGLPQPRAVYVGALEDWIDWELVETAARGCSDISIVFIGGVNSGCRTTLTQIESLRRYPNLHFLGPKSHQAAISYLAGADAAIIPFRNSRTAGDSSSSTSLHGIACKSPMKLFEYLAFGLPVVSTVEYWAEVSASIETPTYLASDSESFVSSLKNATEEGARRRNELRALGRKFSFQNTWNRRVSTLLKRCDFPPP